MPTRRLRRNPLRRMDGGSPQPSWRERSLPHPHGLTGGAQQKPVGTASAIHGAGWRLSRARDGENSASLIFLSPPRSASALLGRAFFLHYPPHMDGGDNVAGGAIITLSPPTAGGRKGRMPSLPYPSCGRMPNEERRERDDGRRSRAARPRASPTVARCGLLRRKRSCSRS